MLAAVAKTMTTGRLISITALSFVLACDSDRGTRGSDEGSTDEQPREVYCDGRRNPVPADKVCDGVVDCKYGGDEEDCPESDATVCHNDDEYRQRLYTPDQHCNGRAECFFAEDEEGCPESLLCPNFTIGGGFDAVPRSKICDGVWDCSIDERDCPGVVNPFTCPDGHTIDPKFVCDQVIDCVTGWSDETSWADETDPSCHQFMCESPSDQLGFRSCVACKPVFVPAHKVCDGVRDCGNGLDESSCK